MARLEMQKVRLAVGRNDAKALFAELHNFGNFELIETQDESLSYSEASDFEHKHMSAELDSAVEFLSAYHKPSFFRGLFEGGREYTNPKEMGVILNTYDPEPVIEKVRELQSALSANGAKKKELDEKKHALSEWTRLDGKLEDLAATETTQTYAVRAVPKVLAVAQDEIAKEPLVAVEPVSDSTMLVTCHKNSCDDIEGKLSGYELEVLDVPNESGTATEALARIEKESEALAAESEKLETEAIQLAQKELPSLKKASDAALWEMREVDTAEAQGHTERISLMYGWVPARFVDMLTTRLEEKLPAVALESVTPEENEEPPVEIQNGGLFNSFETITRLYGVPTHKDIDPTPFLSIFFFIFFGMSLSDVGYGAILMFLTGIVLWKFHLARGMKQLLTMLFFGGLGSFIVGFIFGGYLGVAPADIHPALTAIQLFDPINNPLPVFYLALGLGVVQIMFGIVLDILRTVKQKDTLNGILDNVPWLLMFFVFIFFLIASVGLFPTDINALVLAHWGNVAIGVAVLIMITKGRTGKGIFGKISSGILSLYGGVGYFSDILSYSRLLALGLATGALGFSINLIAGFAAGESLGIGTIFAVLILVLGHTLNITLSILGAFIHSARLQFVEFFGKFLTGTGRPFKAFKKEERNVILLPDTPT